MANLADWVEGARPRTLPASVAPVFAGTGIAMWLGHGAWDRALLAGLVALLFQIGVNFSNDYSDGIRGTDDVRTGPPRLTGGGKAKPELVKYAALGCFAAACAAGLGLVALSGQWWLIALGAVAVLAAWYYTGGKHPYGYMGLGEVFVFVFFGLMATAGTIYTQALVVPWQGWLVASSMGLIACGLLMVNNIRDIPTDSVTGKKTVAVRLGDPAARWTYVAMIWLPFASLIVLAWPGMISDRAAWWIVFFLPALYFLDDCRKRVLGNSARPAAHGRDLIPVLRNTGFLELAMGLAYFAAFALA